MKDNIEYVWYASYGSNMLGSRFLCYIEGGKPPGAQRNYRGCTNKASPMKSKPITINAELYFARRSITWHGGGAAFIDPDSNSESKTLGRMYLITAEQFVEVLLQECRHEGDLKVDLSAAIRKGSLIIQKEAWYGKLLFLGFDEGYPIFTFTNEQFLRKELNAPHANYLTMIRKGLEETYELTENEIDEYLSRKKGYLDLLPGE